MFFSYTSYFFIPVEILIQMFQQYFSVHHSLCVWAVCKFTDMKDIYVCKFRDIIADMKFLHRLVLNLYIEAIEIGKIYNNTHKTQI